MLLVFICIYARSLFKTQIILKLRIFLICIVLSRCFFVYISPIIQTQALTLIYRTEVPFLLFEDTFRRYPVSACAEYWQLLETTSALTGDPFLGSKKTTKSKLTLLRIANTLLKRLSSSLDTDFCGRILMYVSSFLHFVFCKIPLTLVGSLHTASR